MADDAAHIFHNAQVVLRQFQIPLGEKQIVKGHLHVRRQVQTGFNQPDGGAGKPRFRCALASGPFGRPFKRLTETGHIFGGRLRNLVG